MAQELEKFSSNSYVDTIQLEKYRGKGTRYTCPHCGKQEFTRYVNVVTGEHIADENGDYIYGMCNRKNHCDYYKFPSKINVSVKSESSKVKKEYREPEVRHCMSLEDVVESINSVPDFFSQFLYERFDYMRVSQVLRRYKVGSMPMWGYPQATVFWQIDVDNRVRTGKVMLYDKETGKRVKKPFPHISWVHSSFQNNYFQEDYNLLQCMFGEHLLKTIPSSVKQIHVVESEKTAILCSIVNPNLYWVATGGLQNINHHRLLPFSDKELIFYPDKGKAYSKWEEKLKGFDKEFNIKISNTAEGMADLGDGDDIGDFILLQNTKINK